MACKLLEHMQQAAMTAVKADALCSMVAQVCSQLLTPITWQGTTSKRWQLVSRALSWDTEGKVKLALGGNTSAQVAALSAAAVRTMLYASLHAPKPLELMGKQTALLPALEAS